MIVELNKGIYYVNDGDFVLQQIPEYNTLQLYPQLGIFEREIGLINEIIEISRNSIFVNIGANYGGFVPLHINNMSYIVDNNAQNITNLQKNCKLHNKTTQIKLVNDLKQITEFNDNDKIKIVRIDDKINVPDLLVDEMTILLTYQEYKLQNHKKYCLTNSKLIIYVPLVLIKQFEHQLNYYLHDNNLNYDNLINLCMIVKDAGDGFRHILENNLPFIDQFTIIDTGSADHTIDIIKDVLKTKKGILHQEPFTNFRDSRNRCLELAGNKCKYTIMLDDTYILKGNVREFLTMIRSDQFADSYNIFVNSFDCIYGSNRILKSDRQLKYIYRIHEVVQNKDNITIQIPFYEIHIQDITNEYMITRTNNRKLNDLKLLFETLDEYPNVSRTLYYIATTYIFLKQWDEAYKYAMTRIKHDDAGYSEEITECYLICADIANNIFKWEWNRVEPLYLASYEHDKSKADALYGIGLRYFNENNVNLSYEYFKKAFNLGISPTATSNLRIILYNDKIPYYLTLLCYLLKDHKLGLEASNKYLQYNVNNTILLYNKIFRLLDMNNNTLLHNNMDKILCFVADGGFAPWSGSSIDKVGIGGSETFIIELSRQIAKITDYNVYVFCNTAEDEVYDGVTYMHLNKYVKFINQNKVSVCIISRYVEYIPVTLVNEVENIYFVVHDNIPQGYVLPLDDKIKGILCMSDIHRKIFLDLFPMVEHKTFVFPNGINIEKFDTNIRKIKNSFIYSSFADRGLVHLLEMFPKIKTILPNAVLHIFCDINNNFVRQDAPDEMRLIEQLLEKQKEYVIYHGWVKKDVLINYFLQSEYWLYPCKFLETFCVTALEAAASNTIAITNDLGALVSTVGDRGIVIKGNPETEEWQNKVIDEIVKISNNLTMKNALLQRNRKFAKEHDWQKLAGIFVNKYLKPSSKYKKYYAPLEENINYLCHKYSYCKKVLEVGPGTRPFPLATHFVDHIKHSELQNLLIMDITQEKLPYNDNEFDLVYCRHVIEDVNNPDFIIKELVRVGKIVYIETPSPLVETSRYIDGSSPYYRGYIHHRSIVWTHGNTLKIISKYPIIEYINIPEQTEQLENKYYWNTYFIWDKTDNNCDLKVYLHDIDYNLHSDYEKMINVALVESKISAENYCNNFI